MILAFCDVWNVSRSLTRVRCVNIQAFNHEVFEKYSGDAPAALTKRFFEAFDFSGNGIPVMLYCVTCLQSPSLICGFVLGLLDGEEFVCGMFILLKGTNTERYATSAVLSLVF
jgi:hypothetical protein